MLNPELRERLWPFLGGIAKTKRYGTRAFQQEYVAFLKRHELSFDDKYLWD